jgi:endonuclease YncB( thermonuclease family)
MTFRSMLLCLALAYASVCTASTISGPVTSVHDGDTLRVSPSPHGFTATVQQQQQQLQSSDGDHAACPTAIDCMRVTTMLMLVYIQTPQRVSTCSQHVQLPAVLFADTCPWFQNFTVQSYPPLALTSQYALLHYCQVNDAASGSSVRMRVFGVDAPELSQNCKTASGESYACGKQ